MRLVPTCSTLSAPRCFSPPFFWECCGITWPDPPWPVLQIVGVIVVILAPFIFYPFSKTLFLAFDLAFRPASGDDSV